METIADRLRAVRKRTEALCAPLEIEDYVVQPETCVSPPKWHLAHTSWFFETFLLLPYLASYPEAARGFSTSGRDPDFAFLFNSYYESVGPRADKGKRGAFSRPTVAEVYAYRRRIDEALGAMLASARDPEIEALAELGLNHEQQHQELLVTDIKRIFHFHPSPPSYVLEGRRAALASIEKDVSHPGEAHWLAFKGGMHAVGWDKPAFAFDNERPRHPVFLRGFRLEDRPVTNGRYLEFIRDGGYARPELWLSEGWRLRGLENWQAPLYWSKSGDGSEWTEYGLSGVNPLRLDAPVMHVSYYEADAFARWRRARLATEQEWEVAADSGRMPGIGETWEWTASAYLAYPGYRPWSGAVGEYNGKFMMNQMVLRGGSFATPRGHCRVTYRNFFPAETRWQFSGIRLAEDA